MITANPIPRMLLILCLAVLAAEAPGVETFTSIPTEDPVTAFALTDDGAFLVLAQEEADRLSIWDVDRQVMVTDVAVPAPCFVLARGPRIFAISAQKGSIAVVDEATWKLTDQIQVGDTDINYLSAARGKHYDGTLVITAPGEVLRLDVRHRECQVLAKGRGVGAASLTCKGDALLLQGPFSLRPSGPVSMTTLQDLVAGKNPTGYIHADAPLLTQVQDGDLWVGGAAIYRGSPPQAAELPTGMPAMDASARRLYRITTTRIDAYGMDAGLPDLGSWSATMAMPMMTPWNTMGVTTEADPWQRNVAQAVTRNGRTHLFVPADNPGQVFTVDLPPLGSATEAATAGGAASAIAAIAATAGKRKPGAETFPVRVEVGTAITHALEADGGGGTFSLIAGPTGMTVSPAGLVTWTPQTADVGLMKAQIRAEHDGDARLVRLACEVIAKNGEAGPSTAFTPLDAVLPVTTMTLTEDGTCLVLAHEADDLLSIWDVKKGLVVRTVPCPSPHWLLSRGGRTYVANLGRGMVTSFDEHGWRQETQFPIPVPNVEYLSAADGRFFDGTILISAGVAQDFHFMLLDTRRKTCKNVLRGLTGGIATVNYHGDEVYFHRGDSTGFMAHAPLAGLLADPAARGQGSLSPGSFPYLLTEVADGFWAGEGGLFIGDPPAPMPEPKARPQAQAQTPAPASGIKGGVTVTIINYMGQTFTDSRSRLRLQQTAIDIKAKRVYRISNAQVEAIAMTPDHPLVQTWATVPPVDPVRDDLFTVQMWWRFSGIPQAVTLGNLTHIFALGRQGTVLTVALPVAGGH